MNNWEEFAKIFGLELDEEFQFKYSVSVTLYTGKITKSGIMKISNAEWIKYSDLAVSLLAGTAEVIRKPLKPKYSDMYWHWSAEENAAVETYWCNTTFDYLVWKAGNCFKTYKEAEKRGKEIMEKILKEFENE